jgi:hypothetical protein
MTRMVCLGNSSGENARDPPSRQFSTPNCHRCRTPGYH